MTESRSKSPLVWVVGDVMLDVSVTPPNGKQFKRSQERNDVPVLPLPDLTVHQSVPGGAANLAANLAGLGCRVVMLGGIPDDTAGATLQRALDSFGVSVNQLCSVGKTTTKTRYYEGNNLVARLDDDHNCPPVSPPANADDCVLPNSIVLTDYGRGSVTSDSAKSWADFAATNSIDVYADPKDGRQHVWNNVPVTCMVANWVEACGSRGWLSGGEFSSDVASDDTARRLADTCVNGWGPFKSAVIKRGVYGSYWASKSDAACVRAVKPQQVYDVQGAGDTYLAGLVTARCNGLSWFNSCMYASAAAGVAVGRPGTAVVNSADVVQMLHPLLGRRRGVVTYDEAVTVSEELRGFGFKIGYTNGCYDLQCPHPGHIATLEFAATACDFLFVGVDSDARVRKLKGADRPIVSANDRVKSVSVIHDVGAAFVFDDGPERVLTRLRPDVLIKGGDYCPIDVFEAEIAKEWGGELLIGPKIATMSSTQRHIEAKCGV